MTENEAQEKICHRTLSFMGGEDGVPSWQQTSTCIGSACMAWRLIEAAPQPTRVHPAVLDTHWKGWAVTDATPDSNGHVEISPPASQRVARGFCGLAGKP